MSLSNTWSMGLAYDCKFNIMVFMETKKLVRSFCFNSTGLCWQSTAYSMTVINYSTLYLLHYKKCFSLLHSGRLLKNEVAPSDR